MVSVFVVWNGVGPTLVGRGLAMAWTDDDGGKIENKFLSRCVEGVAGCRAQVAGRCVVMCCMTYPPSLIVVEP